MFFLLFNGDKDEVLKRAKITEQGKLTQDLVICKIL
jgi:hypothetical protein